MLPPALADESTALPPAVDEAHKAISLNFYEEPRTLDAQRAADVMATMILGHTSEGLTRLDPGNRPFPAQAERWEQPDKTHVTFTLRAEAQWSDGRPVIAQDFVYAWRRAVDPALASEYAFIMRPLKNAQLISAGKLPPDQLGVAALDERTLAVTLERPTAYFLKLLAFTTYYPARADIVARYGAAYAADADKMVFNGPFVLSEWRHNTAITLAKNPRYWNRAEVGLNAIRMPKLVRAKDAEYALFKRGEFALTWSLTKELVPEARADKAQLRKYNQGSVWYFQFNTRRPVTGNRDFRKALQLAMNRGEFVRDVQGIPGSKPIFGIVPEYMPGVSRRYGEEYPLVFPDAQVAEARRLLARAQRTLGLAAFPPLVILASDTDDVRRDMGYFQRYFRAALGLELTPLFLPLKARLERTGKQDFDIVNSGWSPDYLDAMTFVDLFASWNKNNNTGWADPAYDENVRKAADTAEPRDRLELLSQAERILVAQAPVVPYFQQFRNYVQDPRLVGVVRRTVGADPDFYYAKLVEPVASRQ